MISESAIRRGLVIGCGGTLGFAWSAVAVKEVQRQLDWNPSTASVLVGTSAGSELVAALGAGYTPGDLLDALDGKSDSDPVLRRHVAAHPGMVPPLPRPSLPALGMISAGVRRKSPYSALAGLLPRGRGDATFLHEFGDALAEPETGWVSHSATWCVSVDSRTGQRVAFGSPEAPHATLGQAVAASWGIPGWFPPVRIGHRSYLDGGVASTASVDLVIPLQLDEVVVIAPMTTHGGVAGKGMDRAERLLRSQMTRVLDREVAAVESAGTRVIRIEPGVRELAAMGPNFMDLRRRENALAVAAEELPRTVSAALERTARL